MGNINHMVVPEITLNEFIGMHLQQDSPIKSMHLERINSTPLADKMPDMELDNPEVIGPWIATTEEIQNGHGIIIHTPLPILMVSHMVAENQVPTTLDVIIIIHLMTLEMARSKRMKKKINLND